MIEDEDYGDADKEGRARRRMERREGWNGVGICNADRHTVERPSLKRRFAKVIRLEEGDRRGKAAMDIAASDLCWKRATAYSAANGPHRVVRVLV